MLTYGNLIELAGRGDFDVVIHGCNCFNTMGAGIAKSIREAYPQAYIADLNTKKGDMSKLGSFTSTDVVSPSGYKFKIINAYTQFNYSRDSDNFSYDTFPDLLSKIKKEFGHLRIGMPLIGCNLAGGDEFRILNMIKDGFSDVDYKIVEINRNRVLKTKDPRFDINSFKSPINIDFPAPFKYKGIDFFSSSQFVSYSRAALNCDEVAKKELLMLNDNKLIKQLISREINGFDVVDSPNVYSEYKKILSQIPIIVRKMSNVNQKSWESIESSSIIVSGRNKLLSNPDLLKYVAELSDGLFLSRENLSIINYSKKLLNGRSEPIPEPDLKKGRLVKNKYWLFSAKGILLKTKTK